MTAIKLPSFIKKQPVAMVCALFCVGLALAIYFQKTALAKAQADLDDKTSQANHLKENVNSANSLSNKADRLDEQYAKMTQAIQAIEARLVRANQLAINLQYFYKLEADTQTKLVDLRQTGTSASAKNSGKAYVGVDYSINVQGSYLQLLDFLRRVENGEHFSRVKGLTLSGAGAGETPVAGQNFSLSLNLEFLGLP
jgi:capsid protein